MPGDSEDLGLVTAPIITRLNKEKGAGRKELCIGYATTALEFLKENSEVNDMLAPLKVICGATLNVLRTIEVGISL